MQDRIESEVEDQMDDTDRAYVLVKDLVKTPGFPPHTELQVRALSLNLAPCSAQAIQRALSRLAREGEVLEFPGRVYYTKHLSSSEICTLYEHNRALVDRSLEKLQGDQDAKDIIQFSQMFSRKNSVSPPSKLTPDDIAQMTKDLFLHIVHQAGEADWIPEALRINEQLSYIRQCECMVVDGPAEELGYLCHLYHRNEIEQLRRAVKDYHLTRFKIIPRLMAIL